MDNAALLAVIPRLRRYARLLTGDPTRADDLVQETLARGCEKWSLFQPGSDLRAWLFTIMHNQFANQYRVERRYSSVHVGSDDRLSGGKDLDGPDSGHEPTVQLEQMLDLRRGMARLSVEHRQVLLLVALEDLSYAEVAEVLGVPVGTVMSRLSRAREQLRMSMQDTGVAAGGRPALRVAK